MSEKLDNAPLAEVVFEIRWAGVAIGSAPVTIDPGYSRLLDGFTKHAAEIGFGRTSDMQPAYTGFAPSVSRRYYSGVGTFPLLQIGPGTFASNASAEYDWRSFKERSLAAATAAVSSYPRLAEHKLNISHVELRYIDIFDDTVAPVQDLMSFLNEATKMKLGLTDFWQGKAVGTSKRGRVTIEVDTLDPPGAKFSFDIASAASEESTSPVIRMESKVFSTFDNVLPSSSKLFEARCEKWLESAHKITHEVFQNVVRKEVLEKFK